MPLRRIRDDATAPMPKIRERYMPAARRTPPITTALVAIAATVRLTTAPTNVPSIRAKIVDTGVIHHVVVNNPDCQWLPTAILITA
jgi:hypothetical protein